MHALRDDCWHTTAAAISGHSIFSLDVDDAERPNMQSPARQLCTCIREFPGYRRHSALSLEQYIGIQLASCGSMVSMECYMLLATQQPQQYCLRVCVWCMYVIE